MKHKYEEIERKYLLKGEIPRKEIFKRSDIKQSYLFINSRNEFRVRNESGRCTLTIKNGMGKNRLEVEIPISRHQFIILSKLSNYKINKKRIYLKYEKCIITVDTIRRKNTLMKIIEVEFKNERDSLTFKPPEWFGKEVTYDENFKSKNLAKSHIKLGGKDNGKI